MKQCIFLFFVFAFFVAGAQPIDSLKSELNRTEKPREQIDILDKLASIYIPISTDTALMYTEKALKLLSNDSLNDLLSWVWITKGSIHQKRNEYSKADSLFNLAISLTKERREYKNMARAYNNYGLSKSNQLDFETAIEHYLIASAIADSLKMKDLSINTSVNIGIIYYYQENIQKALDFHKEAIKKFEKYGMTDYNNYATTLRNTGGFYSILGNQDSAFYYTNRALEVSERINDLHGVSVAYQNLGEIISEKEPEKSEEYFLKSLEIKKKLKNLKGIAHTNLNIGDLYAIQENYPEAIKYYYEGLKYAYKIMDYGIVYPIALSLSTIYNRQGRPDSALKYYKIYSNYKDSLTANTNKNKLLDLQTQYETAEKEKEIMELKLKQKIDQITIRNSKSLTLLSIGASVIVLVLLIIVYRALIVKRKRNHELKQKNVVIEQQKEEIMAQRDHLAQQNIQISEQHKKIEDSIAYASQIQNSLLPQRSLLNSVFGDYFIYYKPKDVVSGDFYWVYQDQNNKIIAVGDCTGHGVPGAFMSVLSISLLNEIVKSENVYEPSLILKKMREHIIMSLKQKGGKMGGSDGLELSLININKTKSTLKFSGAQRPMIIVREKKLIEYKPDRMPISAFVKMDDFEQHEVSIQSGDCIFMFSDGFQDQFNGSSYKKYNKQRFYDLLVSISTLEMAKQRTLMEREFESWKSNEEQIDDVLVFGIKI